MNFKNWLVEQQQNGPTPSTQLEKVYLDMMSKMYKPTTVASLFQNNPQTFFAPQVMFDRLFDMMYNDLRTPNDLKQSNVQYPTDQDIDQYTGNANAFVRVKNENKWNYRIPNNYDQRKRQFQNPDKSDDRVSFAGLPVKGLIDALDQFVQRRVAYYKTPEEIAGWQDRHDPITIYFKEPVTPQIKAELQSAVAPFSRDKYIPAKMDGDVFAPGLSHQQSPGQDDIKRLVQEGGAISPELAKVLTTKFTRREGGVKASAGQITAARQLMDLIRKTPQQPAQQQPQQPQQPRQQGPLTVSVRQMERDFALRPGTLDIMHLPKSGMVSVRNRLTGKVLSVKPSQEEIEHAVVQLTT